VAQWRLGSVTGGHHTLTNRDNGLLADVSGASTAENAAVIQWPSHGGGNQHWQLVPL
jgi:hypothetical protein